MGPLNIKQDASVESFIFIFRLHDQNTHLKFIKSDLRPVSLFFFPFLCQIV